MPRKLFSLIALTCASLALVGCESQRYKPAAWKSKDNSTLADRAAPTGENSKKNLQRPQSPTDWMELSGTGGEAVAARRYNGTMPYRNGTMPYRNGTLPYRNGTMPYRNGTLPYRGGTSLPYRGGNISLPDRQYRWDANNSGSTMPMRKTTGTLPRR